MKKFRLLSLLLFTLIVLSVFPVFAASAAETEQNGVYADYIGCQSTKSDGKTFDLRLIAGLDSLDHQRTGFQITVFTVLKSGEKSEQTYDADTVTVYDTLNANGKKITASELGYRYLSVYTVKDIVADAASVTVLARPRVTSNVTHLYGKATILYLNGESADGYPNFVTNDGDANQMTIAASDDTFVQSQYASQPLGTYEAMEIKQCGDDSNYSRYVYLKFEFPAEKVQMLKDASLINLKVYLYRTRTIYEPEKAAGGVKADVSVTETNWDEKTLTYNLSKEVKTLGKAADLYFGGSGYVACDVTRAVHDAIADGKSAISFRISNVYADGSDNPTTLMSKENGAKFAPLLELGTDAPVFHHQLDLTQYLNDGSEPWGYTEKIVDEWMNGTKDKVYNADQNQVFRLTPVDITKKQGAYTVYHQGRTTGNPPSGTYGNMYVRTVDTLASEAGYDEMKAESSEYDSYGGIINAGFTGKATGYFHSEKINDRYYIIDPLGNPYFVCGVNTLDMGATGNQQKAALTKYGSINSYWENITKGLMENGINSAATNANYLRFATSTATPVNGVCSMSGIKEYSRTLNLFTSTGGSSTFANNNTMNVFDPDFESFMYTNNRAMLTSLANNTHIIGYTSDNELPKDDGMLENYLTLDSSDPVNAFSYAAAWTWLAARTGTANPSYKMITPVIREEFKAFVFSRLFSLARDVIDAYDGNHMYVGTRADGANKTSEGYLRAAGAFCDVLTINMYDTVQPSVDTMATIYRYSGKPFIVTEFYAKAEDAYDANGQLLANQQNAGWLVKTQEDRANYYENYTLLLLESKYCVGWVWYKFQDNDQSLYTNDGGKTILRVWQRGSGYNAASYIDQNGNIVRATGNEQQIYYGERDTSNLGSNKGMVDNSFEFYYILTDSVKRINDNLFSLIRYFDNLHK